MNILLSAKDLIVNQGKAKDTGKPYKCVELKKDLKWSETFINVAIEKGATVFENGKVVTPRPFECPQPEIEAPTTPEPAMV